ncbi:MAG TPA: CaiB/BaiF CoA-transferase family protein, partial [Ohtaekwangia sp.]|nr:CaiB/BaiF CoA-transferase family protein [Ohtaekwangia sp.]
PSVGQFFAELGATVIKVENATTGGDVTRCWKLAGEQTDDRSAYFCAVNWGKKSVALDLTAKDHREVVHKLAAKADLVIASYKPGDARKLGVDYETLSAFNPALVYGQVTGYGSDNPRVGYDAVIQAEAGFMFMNGEKHGPSLKMPVALVDILAGHHLKEAILLALLEKTRTGQGKLVEVSLIQSAIASLANQGSNWLVAKRLPQKEGSSHPNIAPYGDVFITRDGKEVLLAVGSDKQFSDLCAILGLSVLATDEKFITNQARVTNRTDLNAALQRQVSRYDADDLLKKIHASRIPAGVIQNLMDVFAMKEAREMMLSAGGITGVKSFVGNHDTSNIHPPPHLGEHTAEILQGL